MTKLEIIKKYRVSENDTGSSAVQIALLTSEILHLNEHFKEHKKDHHSKRGFMKKLERRRKLISYLRKEDPNHCANLLQSLGLRK